jgi:hypothetical protein
MRLPRDARRNPDANQYLAERPPPAARAHAAHLAEATERAIFTAVIDSVIALIEAAPRD